MLERLAVLSSEKLLRLKIAAQFIWKNFGNLTRNFSKVTLLLEFEIQIIQITQMIQTFRMVRSSNFEQFENDSDKSPQI